MIQPAMAGLLSDTENIFYFIVINLWKMVVKSASPRRDPFDRMLIAQARVEDLKLLTVDAQIQKYLPQ